MILRPYQEAARAALWEHFHAKATNPAIVLPTGSGKSPLMAAIVADAHAWGSRTLIVAHRKELLEQTAHKIGLLAPEAHCGLYSAGLGCKDTLGDVIVAGVQSAFRNANELGHFDLLMVDEAHLINSDEGMYRTLIDGLKSINPHIRIAGLTATPYRMDSGMICQSDGILNEVCYEAGVKELIRDGYLCKLISKTASVETDFSGVKMKGGEFESAALEAAVNADGVVKSSVKEIIERCADRRSVIVFCQGRSHAKKVCAELTAQGQQPEYVDGESLPFEREDVLERFKNRRVKFLVNIDVLTVGFDAPNIDCVAVLRPTLSPGLFYQMLGRGFRLDDGKKDCLILDFGGNLLRHGPVDMITPDAKKPKSKAPVKTCPKCKSVMPLAAVKCADCDYVFPKAEDVQREIKQDGKAANKGVISGQKTRAVHPVQSVIYNTHEKKDAPSTAPRSMRVSYYKSEYDNRPCATQYVCFEHSGFAREKAVSWWTEHRMSAGLVCPVNTDEAVALARDGHVKQPVEIEIEETAGKPFAEILRYKFADEPAPAATGEVLFSVWDDDAEALFPGIDFQAMQSWIFETNHDVKTLQIWDGAAWHVAKDLGFIENNSDEIPF